MTLADLYYEMLDMVALTVIISGVVLITCLVLLVMQIVVLKKIKNVHRNNTKNYFGSIGFNGPIEQRPLNR